MLLLKGCDGAVQVIRSDSEDSECVCVCVVRRNPWLALTLSRPQVIQLNTVRVVMATYALHTAVFEQDEGDRLRWVVCAVWSPLQHRHWIQ